MVKIYWPVSSESNFPKLTRTTLGFPGRGSLSADPKLGISIQDKLCALQWCFHRLAVTVFLVFTFNSRWLGKWRGWGRWVGRRQQHQVLWNWPHKWGSRWEGWGWGLRWEQKHLRCSVSSQNYLLQISHILCCIKLKLNTKRKNNYVYLRVWAGTLLGSAGSFTSPPVPSGVQYE